MTFKLTESEKSLTGAFADYIKKINAFCPMPDKQLFVLLPSEECIRIYSTAASSQGGRGVLQQKIAVEFEDTTQDKEYFILDVTQLNNAIKKIRSNNIIISFRDNKLILVNEDNKKNSITLNTFDNITPEQVEETLGLLSDTLSKSNLSTSSDETISVDLDTVFVSMLSTFGDLAKLLDVNDSVAITSNSIYTADNICISTIKIPSPEKPFVNRENEEIFIHRDLISTLKNSSKFLISDDKSVYYLETKLFNIEFAFMPRNKAWQFPSEEDLASICPEDSRVANITITTESFFNSLEQFKGLFASSKWRFEQVYVESKLEDLNNGELLLYYDDMSTEVREFMKINSSDIKNVEDSNFLLPCLHINKLQDIIKMSETITISFSDLSESEEHGGGIVVKTDNLTLIVAKLLYS